jgi:hypothetical protein
MAVTPKPPSSKLKGIQFVLRPYRRVPSRYALHYLSADYVGKGVVTNLSQSGVRIQGEHAVEPGLCLALRIKLPNEGPTIEVERATVRWVEGYDFGMEFDRLSPLAVAHITHTLSQMIRTYRMSC